MKIKFKIIFLFLAILKVSCDSHPHGESKNILSIRQVNGENKFINEVATIESIFLHPEVKDRKVVVLSIIGAYRKGKSFFNNYCLRFLYANYRSINNLKESKPLQGDWMGDGKSTLKGFSWQHGSEAETKGILIWSDVFLYDSPTEKIAIVIMDTQGLFEPGSTYDENQRIFGLSTLLSSVQILNIKDVLQEDQLVHLKTATDLTKIVVSKQTSSTSKPFQSLLFLFRDWTDVNYKPGYVGGQKYLERKVLKQLNTKETDANSVRKNIRDSFDEITGYLLQFPGSKINQREFKGEWSLLEPDFISGLRELIESLLSPENLIKKVILGKEVTAAEFQEHIKAYFNAFTNTKLPNVENVVEVAINSQMQAIVNDQLRNYNQHLANLDIDLKSENFLQWIDEIQETSFKSAIDGFNNAEKIEDKDIQRKFLTNLKGEIETVFKNWKIKAIKMKEAEEKRIKIEQRIDAQLEIYQDKMHSEVDFNQDDFETYYTNLHETLKAEVLSDFSDSVKFDSEEAKLTFLKSLTAKIDKSFTSIKATKTGEYNHHLNEVKSLADKQLIQYKLNLNKDVDYSFNNFEDHINSLHYAAIISIINAFDELKIAPKKSQIMENLDSEIEIYFQEWSKKALAHKDKLGWDKWKEYGRDVLSLIALSGQFTNLPTNKLSSLGGKVVEKAQSLFK